MAYYHPSNWVIPYIQQFIRVNWSLLNWVDDEEKSVGHQLICIYHVDIYIYTQYIYIHSKYTVYIYTLKKAWQSWDIYIPYQVVGQISEPSIVATLLDVLPHATRVVVSETPGLQKAQTSGGSILFDSYDGVTMGTGPV